MSAPSSRKAAALARRGPRPPVWTLALLLLAACGRGDAAPVGTRGEEAPQPRSEASAPAPVEKGPLIVFLGDSLSAGLHLPAADAFPAVLQRLMVDEGLPFRLVNAGVSGDTTAGGLRRIDWILRQQPDWVVVELGGNDGLRGQPLDSIESNLRAIIEKIEDAGARVVLLGQVMPPNYGPDYTSGFRELYDRIAADDANVVYVPFFLEGVGGHPDLNFEDGIHPTAEGHRLIAEKLAPFFREMLEGR